MADVSLVRDVRLSRQLKLQVTRGFHPLKMGENFGLLCSTFVMIIKVANLHWVVNCRFVSG